MTHEDSVYHHMYETNEGIAEHAERIASLEELVADMLMCLTWQYEPHGYMEDGCNCCRFRGKTHGECGLGMFRGRSSELGVEVGYE